VTVAIGSAGGRRKPPSYPRPAEVVEKRNADEARRAALVARYKAQHPEYVEPE
jgi:hypothetical protein